MRNGSGRRGVGGCWELSWRWKHKGVARRLARRARTDNPLVLEARSLARQHCAHAAMQGEQKGEGGGMRGR